MAQDHNAPPAQDSCSLPSSPHQAHHPKTSDDLGGREVLTRGFEVEGDVFRGVEHQSTVLETESSTYQLGALGYDYLDRRVRARIEVQKDVLTLQQQGEPVEILWIEDIGPAQSEHPGSEL